LVIQPLCNSAFEDIKNKVSLDDVVHEVLSWVTAGQERIMETQCELLISNFRDQKTIRLVKENIGHITDGSSSYCGGALKLGLKKAFELKKKKRQPPVVHGIATLSRTRPLGQTTTARRAVVPPGVVGIINALVAGTRGPAIMHHAKTWYRLANSLRAWISSEAGRLTHREPTNLPSIFTFDRESDCLEVGFCCSTVLEGRIGQPIMHHAFARGLYPAPRESPSNIIPSDDGSDWSGTCQGWASFTVRTGKQCFQHPCGTIDEWFGENPYRV
ncbi:hypothetical protein BDM02DRAFT_3133524, partial [Thelephora ganbajun]